MIGIDHHISNDGFGDFYKIDPQASATCEVLCQIFEEDKISKECAQCLYTGIVHDTGVFKHSNTTRKTMEYAGMLLEKGVSTTKIIDETFYQKTFVQNQLLGKALLKSQLYADGQIIISNLSEQDFEELHASTSVRTLKEKHQHPTVMGSLISCELQKVWKQQFFYIRSKMAIK